uniref:Uncharacterized protein n=1 Tax=Romanomermis culicivorax TaxID=13658 RepID=A0A915ITB1_ROMCU
MTVGLNLLNSFNISLTDVPANGCKILESSELFLCLNHDSTSKGVVDKLTKTRKQIIFSITNALLFFTMIYCGGVAKSATINGDNHHAYFFNQAKLPDNFLAKSIFDQAGRNESYKFLSDNKICRILSAYFSHFSFFPCGLSNGTKGSSVDKAHRRYRITVSNAKAVQIVMLGVYKCRRDLEISLDIRDLKALDRDDLGRRR